MSREILFFLYSSGISFVAAALVLLLLWRFRARLPQAMPNARSLHAKPVPRVAALALWAGFVAGVLFLLAFQYLAIDRPLAAILGGGFLLALVSFRDDCVNLPAAHRLLAQTTAAGLLVLSWLTLSGEQTISIFFSITMALASIFLIVWMINLFNFMDGSDGLAATMTITGFSALAAAAYIAHFSWWYLPALIVAATLPLWFINFPPARMFIGDVGAVPLGFMAIAFGGLGVVKGGWSVSFFLLIFLPFILDATITLLRRLLRREKIWEAHKTHYYQKLVQLGAGHRGTLFIYAALMIGCALSAVLLVRNASALWVALAVWIIVHLGFFATIDYHCKKSDTL